MKSVRYAWQGLNTTYILGLISVLGWWVPGASAQKTINVPTAATPTIQSGINAASAGDTVLVGPGTYRENIVFPHFDLVVRSSAGAAATVIDGGGSDTTVYMTGYNSRNTILDGFTITNGTVVSNGTNGGGIFAEGDPTIQNNIITANSCNGIYKNSNVTDNGNLSALIQNNVISGTLAGGAGLACDYPGTGVVIGPVVQYAVMIGNTIENNVQATDAGGLVLVGTADIERNIVRNNKGAYAGGMHLGLNTNSIELILQQNIIYGNDSTGSPGYVSAVVIAFAGQASAPLGPFNEYILNNTITGNSLTATSPLAAEMLLYVPEPTILFANNVIASNSSAPTFLCQATPITPPKGVVAFNHNDIFNATGQAASGSCLPQTGLYGNISADPMFNSAATHDYTLKAGSPAIDSGGMIYPTQLVAQYFRYPIDPLVDVAGGNRYLDGTGKGYAAVDMGAYEFAGVSDTAQTFFLVTPSLYEVTATSGPIIFNGQATSTLGVPTGTVTFFVDGTLFGTVALDAHGMASVDSHTFSHGVHIVYARYSGGGVFSPTDTPAFVVSVDSATPSNLTLASSVNPTVPFGPLSFTSVLTESGVPVVGGQVTISIGSTVLCVQTTNAQGSVVCPVQGGLSSGQYIVTSTFAGNGSYSGSTVSVTEVVVDFSIAATPSVQTVNPGDSATYTIVLAGVGGAYTLPVTLSATGLPTGATVSFGQQTLIPGVGPTPTTMTITTAANQVMLRRGERVYYGVLWLPLICLGALRRRWRGLAGGISCCVTALVLLGGVGALMGCGGGYFGPLPQSHAITVTGTSGALSHSTTVELEVR